MIRAKVSCSSVQKQGSSEVVNFHAVYSSDPKSDNAQWAQATPCLSLSMTIDNPAAQGKFEQGKEYFIDLTPVA